MTFPHKLAFILLAVCLCVQGSHLLAQKTTPEDKWYAGQWASVEAFEKKDLPRSADSVATLIHQKAVKARHTGEAAKSFVHLQKFEKQFSENQWNQLYEAMQQEQERAWEPYVQVLHSMMAETLGQYFSEERWRIAERQSQGDSTELESMGMRQLLGTMVWHIDRSLENQPLLAGISATAFPQIVEAGNKPSHLRPSLWDFLVYRGIGSIEPFVNEVDLSGSPFEITEELLQPYDKFVSLVLKAGDVLDPNYQIALRWQQIMKFRMSFPKEKEALWAAELDRMLWFGGRLAESGREVALAERLTTLAAQAKGFPIYSLILYHKAQAVRNSVDRAGKADLKAVAQLLQEGAKAWPKSEGGLLCQQALDDIKAPRIDLTVEQVYLPDQPGLFHFGFTNCKQVHAFVFSVEKRNPGQSVYGDFSVDSLVEWQARALWCHDWPIALPGYGDYLRHTAEAELPRLPAGSYVLALSDKSKIQRTQSAVSYVEIEVSQLGVITTNLHGKGLEVTVLSRRSGTPVEGAEVVPYLRKRWGDEVPVRWQGSSRFVTNAMGQVVLPFGGEEGIVELSVRHGNDSLFHQAGYIRGTETSVGRASRASLFIYTDRKIYRPGQSVHFKAVLMEGDGRSAKALQGKDVKLSLRDVNGNEVRQLQLVTNEFGSCSGMFQLPADVLTGNWSIVSAQGATDFSVEAYKRQKFTVELTPPVNRYKQGDTLEVTGKAFSYSGVALSGATVKYSVGERSGFYWRSRRTTQSEVALGTVNVNEKGEFVIRFASSPTICDRLNLPFYEVEVDVTDLNGETQSATLRVPVDKRTLDLSIDTDGVVWLPATDSLKVNITLSNKAGRPQKGSGSYKVYHMRPLPLKPQLFWDKPDVKLATDEVASGYRYQSDTTYQPVLVDSGRWDNYRADFVRLSNTGWMKRGMVRLVFGMDGDTIFASQTITLHMPENGKVELAEPLVLGLVKDQKNNKIDVVLGSAFPHFYANLEVMADGRLLVGKRIELDGNQLVVNLPDGDYKGQIIKARAWGIDKNRFYQLNDQLYLPDTTRQLNVVLETFREKLTPAASETVKLKIGAASALPAEMMAAMYDASLDVWASNLWTMNLFYPEYFEMPVLNHGRFGMEYGDWLALPVSSGGVGSFGYPVINWYGLFDGARFGSRIMIRGLSSVASQVKFTPPVVVADEEVVNDDIATVAQKELVPSPPVTTEAPIRRNLSETAFFYPHLVTDGNGDVSVTYTVPESLTQWRFMTLAHNKQGFSGQLTRYAQTVKELMVVPEIPRFFREGDELAIAAKVVNLTDGDLEVRTSIELIDMATQQPVAMVRGNVSQTIGIKANANGVAQWWVKVPAGIEAVAVRIRAVGNQHSDGEENVVPVLPDRVMVSESLPVLLARKGKSVHHLKSLEQSRGAEHYKLTFRYTQQPAWEVFKALPYLMEYPHECSEQTFSRLFGYMVGQHIVAANSHIKDALRYWEQQQKTGGKPLESPLMQNEALKSILLQETPWAQAGENETANRVRLLKLLDGNYTNDQIRMALDKLQEMQAGDGAFEWFKGMGTNDYMTRHIMIGFGQMQRMGIDASGNANYQKLVGNGIRYLHQQLNKRWGELSRDTLVRMPGSDEVHLLYALSFFPQYPMNVPTAAARDSVLARLASQKTWQTVMEQAMAALVFHRHGMAPQASELLASIDEKAIGRGTGMVYFRGGNSWRWTDNGIETQALVLEAVAELSPQSPMIQAMQSHLVAQKRAQAWPTTKNTVVAVSAMCSSPAWIAAGVPDQISVGNIKLNNLANVKHDVQSGSYSVVWDAAQVKPSMGRVEIKKQADGVSWGSLHWQYFQPLSEVKAAGGVVTVQKQLFVEKQTPQGTQILPLESTSAQVGDKIVVRLSVSSSEAMDFVHIKDLRSAQLEPVDVMSSYRRQGGLGYYQAVSDASVNFFIDRLPKGNFVMEYALRVRGQGVTSNGFATLQCMYAPEFGSRSDGMTIRTE
ncbi:MAG: MG2 domain-containing protein [Breznakibacter sp.]